MGGKTPRFGILSDRPRRDIGYSRPQQITFCRNPGHHAASSRSSTPY
jgi:hypothetical protein